MRTAIASAVCVSALVVCGREPVRVVAQAGDAASLALRVEPESLQVRADGDVSLKVFVRNTAKTRFEIPSIDSVLRSASTPPSWHSPLFVEIETPESEGWTRAVFTAPAPQAPNPPPPRTIELLPGEERLLGSITLIDEQLESNRLTTTVSYVHPGATIRMRARFANDSPTLNGRNVWSGEVRSSPFTVSAAPGSVPGVRLAGSFQPERREFALGEPMFVLVEVANVGTLPVLLSDITPGTGVTNLYSFTAIDAQERPVPANPKPVTGVASGTRILQPGEAFRQQVMLNQCCRFERTGGYRVKGARVLTVRAPGSASNTATPPILEWPLEESFEITLIDDPGAVRKAENQLIASFDFTTLSLLWPSPLESRFIERLRGPAEADETSNMMAALNRLGRRPYVNGILAVLQSRDGDPAGIAAAMNAVLLDDVTEAVPWVRRLQSSPVAEIQKASADALARLGPKARVTPLENRPGAGQKGDPVPQSRIAQDIRLLDSLETGERLRAAERLGALGRAAQPAIPGLRKMLGDPFPQARIAAAVALARIGDAAGPSLDALIPMLKGMDATSRDTGAAAAAFGRAAEPRLREALKSQEIGVRRRAIEALGLSGAREELSVVALGEALNDGDPDVRLHAVIALGRVGARAARYAPHIARMLAQPSKPLRVVALEALGRLGDPASAPRVRDLTKDDDPLVREYAAAALKRLSRGQTPKAEPRVPSPGPRT